jgi:hypothetical protein
MLKVLIAVGVIVGIFYCLNIAILKKMRIKTSPIIQFNSTTNSQRRELVVTEGHFSEL